MNDRRRLITLAVVMAILALTGSLPTLLSHPLVLPRVVNMIAADLPGQIAVQSCSLSWRQGIVCEQIRYQPPGDGLRVTMPRARSDKGLLTLLLAPHYLGEITLEQPTLTLLSPDDKGGISEASDRPTPADQHQVPASWWERGSLRLTVRDGRIQGKQAADTQPRLLAQAVELGGELTQGTLSYQLAFHGGDMGGQFRAQGFVNLPTTDQPWLPSLISQTNLDIRELQLEPLLELAADRLPQVPRGNGTLNATCRLRMAGTNQIELEGDSSLRELALHGGLLGPDHPRFSQVLFRFQGSRHPAEGWRLTKLDLQSEPLHFSAHGFLDQQHVDFTGQGEADLAQLAGQLPHLLALHQQTTIEQGHLNLALNAVGPLADVQLQADCHTDRLRISQSNHAYTWEKPLQVHAEAALNKGVQVRSLHVQAPFLRADGSRKSDGFSLQLAAELDPLFGELKKIFALDFHARGTLQGDFSSRADNGQTRVESALTIDELFLSRGDETILPSHDLALRASWLGRPWPLTDLRELRLQFSGWPGELNLEARDLAPSGEGSAPPPANCRVDGHLLLERLYGLGRLVPGWLPGRTAAGEMRFATTGHWRGTGISIDTLAGEINDFRLLDGTTLLLRDKRLRLGLEHRPLALGNVNLGELIVVAGRDDLPRSEPAFCRLELTPLRMELRHLLLLGETILVDVGGLWEGPLHGPGESNASLDVLALGKLELLTPWCRQQGWLAPKLDMSGQGRFRLSLRRAAPGPGGEVELNVQAKNLLLSQGKSRLLADPLVELSAQWPLLPGAQESLSLSQCSLRTSRFRVNGSAQLQRRSVPHLLELQGQIQPAAALLAPFTNQLVPGATVTMQGTQGGSLLLSAPLALPLDIRQLTLAAQIPLTELRLPGLTLHDLSLPLELNRGLLRLQVAGTVDGGRVNVQPQWQWPEGPEGQEVRPVLTLAAESEVLSRVPLSRALTGGLLAYLPPLGSLVQASGTIDLTLTHFSLPLHGKRQADFALRLGLGQAKPQAMPVLRELLDSAGLGEVPLRFKERELSCEGKDGALRCAPLRLLAGDAEISLNGQQQRDGSLACRVEVPVSEQLAREAGLVVHGPFVAVAEMSGSRTAPVFDRQAFLGSLAAQLAAALPPPVVEQGQSSEMAVGHAETPPPPPAEPTPL